MSSELEPADQHKRIYHLKRAGESFEDIAERLQLTTAEVIRGYRAYMVSMVSEYSLREREHIVAMELDRLDKMMTPFYIQAVEGEKEGAEVTLKIMAQRAKLLRLDQPTPDELSAGTQIIVVSGSKEDYERALAAGRQRQVTSPDGDDEDEQEAT